MGEDRGRVTGGRYFVRGVLKNGRGKSLGMYYKRTLHGRGISTEQRGDKVVAYCASSRGKLKGPRYPGGRGGGKSSLHRVFTGQRVARV